MSVPLSNDAGEDSCEGLYSSCAPTRDSPVVRRGPMKMTALKQLVSDVNWGDLDFQRENLPPGTSDEPISVSQLITGQDGAIIVTTP